MVLPARRYLTWLAGNASVVRKLISAEGVEGQPRSR